MQLNARGKLQKTSCIERTSTREAVSREGSRGNLPKRERTEDTYMKDRKRQRENRRIKHQEELLSKRSECGYKDMTPYNAVLRIKTKGKAGVVLK